MQPEIESHECPFVFEHWSRPWRPLDGQRPPSGTCHLVRSVPGDLVAAGRSKYEAVRRLADMLRVEIRLHRAGPTAWFSEACAKLDEDDREDHAEAVGDDAPIQVLDGIAFLLEDL